MGETVSKFFIPLDTLPGLYEYPSQCLDELEFNPTSPGVVQVLFMGGIYGFILFKASNMIAEGSELLLLFPRIAPIVGSVVLPILGAVPDGAIVLFSGLGEREKAVEQLSVGVGALAGSTIMLLTIPWYITVLAGRVPIDSAGVCVYENEPGVVSRERSGIEPEFEVMKSGARVMILTSISYVVIETAALLFQDEKDSKAVEDESIFALIGLIFCSSTLVWYIHQQLMIARRTETISTSHSNDDEGVYVLENLIHNKQVSAVESGLISLQALFHSELKKIKRKMNENQSSQPLLSSKGQSEGYESIGTFEEENEDFNFVVESLFKQFDENEDGAIDELEFVKLLSVLGLPVPHREQHQMKKLFLAIDKDDTGEIDLKEFKQFLLQNLSSKQKEDQEKASFKSKEKRKVLMEALRQMAIGTVLVLVFSDPMVEVFTMLGQIVGLDGFYISFVLAPLASNASEFIAAYVYAKKKTKQTATLSLSTLQGAAIMNNTFCLAIFLALIYFRRLQWTFSAETFIILLVEAIIAVVSFKRVHTLTSASFVLALFPLSLLIVYWLKE